MLIAHIIYRLDYGGLENGLVNLVNSLQEDKFQHVIICLTEFSEFSKRIKNPDVKIFSLHKKAGKDIKFYFRLWSLLKKLDPKIVHTRNLPTIECTILAKIATSSVTIHSEHGWVIENVYGERKKYIFLRKICDHFIDRYIALSKDINRWLVTTVGIRNTKVIQIYNGVDSELFSPFKKNEDGIDYKGRAYSLISVGRLDPIKNQAELIAALSLIKKYEPNIYTNLELVIIGDGPEKENLINLVKNLQVESSVKILGSKDNISTFLNKADLFILPSINEGVSNTLLEAMSSGLPVLAADVGGNSEIVVQGKTGFLVKKSDASLFAERIIFYYKNRKLSLRHGKEARKHIEENFSLIKMVNSYAKTYNKELLNKNQMSI